MNLLAKGSTLGPYRVIEQIGAGGMAKIYKAYQPRMERYVALKVLPQHYAEDPTFVERFNREARTIAQLEHQSILPVYDFGEENGITYLAMRYLEGGTLKNVLERGRLSIRDIEGLMTQICAGLDYAHRRGVVHRDVKPSNVMIDNEGAAYLTDFGIAKVLEGASELTETGAAIGTPAYMAPEQALGKGVDSRSDIYALGVILYELICGRVPYQADTPMAVALAHIHEPLPLPRTLNPEIPEPIEAVIIKALAKDPDDRYQTANELALALQGAIQQLGRKSTETTLLNLITQVSASKQDVAGAVALGERGLPLEEVTPERVTPPPPPVRRRFSPWMYAVAAVVLLVVGGLAGAGLLGLFRGAGEGQPSSAPPPTATLGPVAVAPSATPEQEPVPVETPIPTQEDAQVVAAPVTLVFWGQATGGMAEFINSLIDEFQGAHPGIVVQPTHFDGPALLEEAGRASLEGSLPDVLRVDPSTIVPLSQLHAVTPMSQLFPPAFLEQFLDEALAPAFIDGELWGMPDIYGDHLMLMYNRELIEAPPASFEDLIARARELTQGDIHGFAFRNDPYWGAGFYGAFGGWPLDENGRPQFDNQAFIEYLTFVKSLQDEGVVDPDCDYACMDVLFKEGRAAMIINGEWALPEYLEVLGDRLGTVPVPPLQGRTYTEMTQARYYMASRAVLDDPVKRGAVVAFVEFMTSVDVQLRWLEMFKRLPSNRFLAEDPAIAEDPILSGSLAARRNGRPMPVALEMGCAWEAWTSSLEGVIVGELSPVAAAQAAQIAADACVSPPVAADCAQPDVFCIGLVTDVGVVYDGSFNQFAWEGVLQAQAEWGAFVDFIETQEREDLGANTAFFADQGYDVIVTVGFGMNQVTLEAAQTYPQISFIGVDQRQVDSLPNLAGLIFPEDRAGFLAGALAAMLSRTGTIAAVLGDAEVPPIVAFKEGYEAGARYINPDIHIISVYHPGSPGAQGNAFNDPGWGAATAREAIANGADVVFAAAGGTGIGALLEVAGHPGLYCIGVDTDQWEIVPEAHPCLVSSAVKLVQPGVYELIVAAREGAFPGGHYLGFAGLAPFHDFEGQISQDIKDRLAEIEMGLQDGSISTGYNPER